MIKEVYDLVKQYKGCHWGLERVEKANSVFDLIKLLKSPKGVEFAMDEDFLTIDLLNKYRSDLENENIFFDGFHKIENPRMLIVLGGTVEVSINGYHVCEIYNKGNVKVIASENCFVTIENHKEGKAFIESFGQSKVKEFNK